MSEFRNELSDVGPLKIRLDIANGAKQFQEMLKEGIGDLDTAIPARKLLENVSGKSISNPAEFQSVITQLDQELTQLNESVGAANKHYADVRVKNNDIGERSRELSDIYNNHVGVLPGIRDLIPKFLEFAKKPNVTPEEYNALGATYGRVRRENSIQIPGLGGRTSLPFSNARALNLMNEIMGSTAERMHLKERRRKQPRCGKHAGCLATHDAVAERSEPGSKHRPQFGHILADCQPRSKQCWLGRPGGCREAE